ncbi:MAG: amidohydrolase [Eubacterium sp.]|nr:amidohydrolase [Eubacterium sp.]
MNIRFYNARILTMDGGYDIIKGELWVSGNKIIYIGDGTDTDRIYESQPENIIKWDREIDAKNNLLMPGFKDAHTHTAMTFLRSYADDMPLSDWLNTQVFPKEALLTPEDIYILTKHGIMEYLTSGITAGFDMYMQMDAGAKAASECGFRYVLCGAINDFGGTVEDCERDYNKFNNMNELISYVYGFHAEYTTKMEIMEGLAALGKKYKAPIYMHNSETKSEVEGCIERWGKTPTKLFNDLGIYDYGGGGFHCVWMSEEDIDIFKQRKLYAVTNPASNTKLASGIAPIQTYMDKDINLAIGTDGAASNNCLDMFREMFLMTGLAKLREMDASAVSAEKVLKAATSGGALSMGLFDADVLKEGKLADIIMIDMHQPNMQPENNIVKNIVYSGSKQNVKMTMINGNILYEDMKFNIGVEPEDVYKQANDIIQRMIRG